MKYYSVNDVANRFDVCKETVRRWLRSGMLRGTGGTSGGRDWKISEEDLDLFRNHHPEYPVSVTFTDDSRTELDRLLCEYKATAEHLKDIMYRIDNLLKGN